MPFNPDNGECLCHRCGHWWKAKPIDGKYSEPQRCAGKHCKSKVWNQPRKYNLGTLESSLIVVRREKPTGRAAAKLKKVVAIENKQIFEVEASRLDDDGDIGGSINLVKLIEKEKINQPFEFEGELWVGTSAVGTGTGKGWSIVTAHKVVKIEDFKGVTYGFWESRRLPDDHPGQVELSRSPGYLQK